MKICECGQMVIVTGADDAILCYVSDDPVGSAGITAKELARITGKSHSNICNFLKKAVELGVLTRQKKNDPTGGIEYQYWHTNIITHRR